MDNLARKTFVKFKIVDSKIDEKRTMYVIKISEGGKEWTTEQHYTEFASLDAELKAHCVITTIALPAKGTFGLRHMLNVGQFNEKRQECLQDYLSNLAGQLDSIEDPPCVAAFFRSKSEVVAMAVEAGGYSAPTPEAVATAMLKDLSITGGGGDVDFGDLAEKVFKQYDTDGSGTLEKKEITPLLTKLSEEVFEMWKVKCPDLDENFKVQLRDQLKWELDSDMSGSISKEEFRENIKKIVENHGA